jgi:large subunit ribosomal protein L30
MSAKANEIKIKLVRSPIGNSKRQKGTVRALGFRKTLQTVVHKDTPVIRGMINHVRHLVEVVEE